MKEIIFQQQPTKTTCSHTCLSMLTGVNVEIFMEAAGYGGLSDTTFNFFLKLCGVPFIPIGFPRFIGWYAASVKSLNKLGGGHKLLFHLDANGVFTMLDPTCEKHKYAKDGSTLKGKWVNLVYCWPKCNKKPSPLTMEDPFFN